MEEIQNMIAQYGLETVCIAFVVNLITAAVKIPIKVLARKTAYSARITRFIVFLPVLLGFAVSWVYMRWIAKNFIWNKDFITLWLSASSLSLTFYAVFEKLLPVKANAQKPDTPTEAISVQQNGKTEESDKDESGAGKDMGKRIAEEETTKTVVAAAERIVLRGDRHADT